MYDNDYDNNDNISGDDNDRLSYTYKDNLVLIRYNRLFLSEELSLQFTNSYKRLDSLISKYRVLDKRINECREFTPPMHHFKSMFLLGIKLSDLIERPNFRLKEIEDILSNSIMFNDDLKQNHRDAILKDIKLHCKVLSEIEDSINLIIDKWSDYRKIVNESSKLDSDNVTLSRDKLMETLNGYSWILKDYDRIDNFLAFLKDLGWENE